MSKSPEPSPRSTSVEAPPLLLVRGLKGFLAGEERRLGVGEAIVVGRSRKSGMSVRGALRFRKRRDKADLLHSPAFNRVSREHVRIHYREKGVVDVHDLSHNGTFLDGKRVDTASLTDLDQRSHVLSLGNVERLVLEYE